jgi:RNA polymerase subunit RPABC4/transcription elongation factor Spt4
MSASDDWIGEVIIFDPSTSRIAKVMNITKPGRYALRVR